MNEISLSHLRAWAEKPVATPAKRSIARGASSAFDTRLREMGTFLRSGEASDDVAMILQCMHDQEEAGGALEDRVATLNAMVAQIAGSEPG